MDATTNSIEFKPVPLSMFILSIVIVMLSIFCIKAGAPVIIYVYIALFFITALILHLNIKVWIKNGYIQKRNSFGLKSPQVNLNTLSSLRVYRRFLPNNTSYIIRIEDNSSNVLRLELSSGSVMKTSYWKQGASFKRILNMYAAHSNLEFDKLTTQLMCSE